QGSSFGTRSGFLLRHDVSAGLFPGHDTAKLHPLRGTGTRLRPSSRPHQFLPETLVPAGCRRHRYWKPVPWFAVHVERMTLKGFAGIGVNNLFVCFALSVVHRVDAPVRT